MKKINIFTIIICVPACTSLCVFMALDVQIAADEITDTLASDCIVRTVACVAIADITLLCGYKGTFTNRRKNYGHALLWCLPCLLVVLANFPFSALISGAATVERYDILWLFILDCVLIALMEEMLFRGLLLNLVNELLKNKPLAAVIAESAIFALCHLLNLFSGASIGDTVLQVGYTMLTGLMFSFVYVKTGNIWTGVVLHAILTRAASLFTTWETEFSTTLYSRYLPWYVQRCAVYIYCLLCYSLTSVKRIFLKINKYRKGADFYRALSVLRRLFT